MSSVVNPLSPHHLTDSQRQLPSALTTRQTLRDDWPHSTHHQAEVEDTPDDIEARILVAEKVQILAGQHAAAMS